MDDAVDTERKSIKTYVPAYQKAEWKGHADDLDMSLSEFVRSMVQAGRRGFEPTSEEPRSPPSNPRGDGLETRVLELLQTDTYTWDELLEEVAGDVEARLDEALGDLQSTGRVRYSGRDGGYTLVGGDDGGD